MRRHLLLNCKNSVFLSLFVKIKNRHLGENAFRPATVIMNIYAPSKKIYPKIRPPYIKGVSPAARWNLLWPGLGFTGDM
jgi:hypothetical protein